MKRFLQRILQEIMKKKNTWNIRRLVDDSLVPSSKQPSVSYCKLKDFRICRLKRANNNHCELPLLLLEPMCNRVVLSQANGTSYRVSCQQQQKKKLPIYSSWTRKIFARLFKSWQITNKNLTLLIKKKWPVQVLPPECTT